MRKKVSRSNERDILSESLIGKSFEDAKKISGFNGFSLKIFNEEINTNKQLGETFAERFGRSELQQGIGERIAPLTQ
jgi:hypothetical protein